MDDNTSNNILLITTISGIKEEDFNDFKNLGLEFKIHIPGPQASYTDMIIDYIIISSIAFPFDFVKDVIKDESKQAFISLISKVKSLWEKQKKYQVCYNYRSGEEPNYKKPKIVVSFPIGQGEVSVLEIHDNISEELTEKIIIQYFDTLRLQIENRRKEEIELNKLKIPIKTIKRSRDK